MIHTTECLIDKKYLENENLISYLDNFVAEYNSLYRYVWSLLNNQDKLNSFTHSKPNTLKSCLCHKYGYKARIVNSAIQDVKGTRKALKELNKTQLKDLKQSILSLEEDIAVYKDYLDTYKEKASNLKPYDGVLRKYKKLKKSIHYKRLKLNSKKQKLVKLEYEIETSTYSLCFGSKSFFKKQHYLKLNGYKTHEKWLNDFRKLRNKSILYVGEATNLGNQILKLQNTELILTLHKSGSKEKLYGVCNFRYLQENLKLQTESKVSTTYRFIKRENKWCLQALVNIEEPKLVSSSSYGVVGLDFNVGYITLSDVNETGNLVSQKEYKYNSYQTKEKNLNTLRNLAVSIVEYAESKGKDIIIEDLDFKKKKSRLKRTKKETRYNKMLTNLAYNMYMEVIKRKGFRSGVNVKVVNPSYTSKIASVKYCDKKKLNTHQGASYVIARRGLGMRDT